MTKPRIVSLLPGATEWICELGLADQLVGVSHECDHPSAVANLPKVTQSRIDISQSSHEIDLAVRQHSESRTPLFDLDIAAIERLQPDLICTQTLCDVCAVSEADVRRSLTTLANGCQIIDLRAMTFDAVIDDAQAIIRATGNQAASLAALEKLQDRIAAVRTLTSNKQMRCKVSLLEWADPLFCAGHWTPQLINWAGGDDPIGKNGQPSRQIEPDELIAANPDVLLVACCGLDVERNWSEIATLERIDGWRQLDCVVNDEVHVFDGSAYFNRPGPRLVDALEMVSDIICRAKTRSRPLAD